MVTFCIPSHAPLLELLGLKDHPLDTRREPSALEGWILEILYCDPKGSRAFLRILSTKGRGVRLCLVLSKPKGPTPSDTYLLELSSAGACNVAPLLTSFMTW